MPKKKGVVLVHGYNKTKRDMHFLGENLETKGYTVYYVNLPLRFKEVEEATLFFEQQLEKICALENHDKVHMVGHSTGGLVIRQFLNNFEKNQLKVARIVMIATPNHGVSIADTVDSKFKLFTNLFKTIKSLKTDTQLAKKNHFNFSIEAGALAGNHCNLILGKYEEGDNDGLVPVSSVYMSGLADFKVLAYGHKEIHHKIETVELINNFLETGRF